MPNYEEPYTRETELPISSFKESVKWAMKAEGNVSFFLMDGKTIFLRRLRSPEMFEWGVAGQYMESPREKIGAIPLWDLTLRRLLEIYQHHVVSSVLAT